MKLPSLFSEVPSVFGDCLGSQAPWEFLGQALDDLLDQLPSERIEGLVEPGVQLSGNCIVIEKGARVRSGASLHGPVRIGPNSEIRPGAFLRGGVWLEEGCIVGASTEIKRAVFLAGARAPHLNYVGDSILGREVNLGAGTVLSNFRHDGAEINIPAQGEAIATGRRKFGAVLGDSVLTGCNCVLHPGVIVGARTQLYPGVQLRSGIHPADSIIKLRQELEIVERKDT